VSGVHHKRFIERESDKKDCVTRKIAMMTSKVESGFLREGNSQAGNSLAQAARLCASSLKRLTHFHLTALEGFGATIIFT
jgi:hypothetical protein